MLTDDDVLNVARLVEAYDDDIASMVNLLTLACQTEKRYIGSLRDAIARDDLRDVARAAHSIKGSASNIGAGNVSAVAARIEDCARGGRWDGIAQDADALDGAYAELCVRIEMYAAKIA